jgi:hypothetical protein
LALFLGIAAAAAAAAAAPGKKCLDKKAQANDLLGHSYFEPLTEHACALLKKRRGSVS